MATESINAAGEDTNSPRIDGKASNKKRPWSPAISHSWQKFKHHLRYHVGGGLVAAVAYFDPGNWSVDLQAGSTYGYHLLFVILLAGLSAIVLQYIDLARHCRRLLHDHPKHPLAVRWLALYPLYCLVEAAIITTDLAELLVKFLPGFCSTWTDVLLPPGLRNRTFFVISKFAPLCGGLDHGRGRICYSAV